MTIILNGGGKPIEIDDILLDEIEACNAKFECSSMVADAPPKRYYIARYSASQLVEKALWAFSTESLRAGRSPLTCTRGAISEVHAPGND